MSTVDHVLTLSNDPWFADQFPFTNEDHQFGDLQSLFRFLDTNEAWKVIITDGIPDAFAGWSKNHLVIVFHDYASARFTAAHEGGDTDLMFNRDDDQAYEIVRKMVEHMLV